MKKCSVEGCENKHNSLGFCKKHYAGFKRHGNTSSHQYEKHGMTNIPEYKAWWNMISRCYNPKAPNYKYYGGRKENPITVCDRWNI